MANLEGMKDKFIVIKKDDVDYLAEYEKEYLEESIDRIAYRRMIDGRKNNSYIVINTDESYADEVIEILKRNGHWG